MSHPPLFLQIKLPVTITPRWRHSAVVFGSGQGFIVVVLSGGYSKGRCISQTTLLLLGECTYTYTYIYFIMLQCANLCMHYQLLTLRVNKPPRPPYNMLHVKELLYCMKTIFLVKAAAVSYTCSRIQ